MKKIGLLVLIISFSGVVIAETEPNNYARLANPLTLNSAQTANMTSGDVDWFVITLPDDGKLTIDILGDAGLTFSYVDIYQDTAKTYLAESTWGNNHVVFGHNSLATGTYYIKVPQSSGTGNYTINPQYIAATRPNDAEPNDYAKFASVIGANDSLTGRLYYYKNGVADLVDWYKVTLPSDGKLEVLLKGEPSVIFSYVDLYNDTSNSYLYESTWGNTNTSVYYNALSQDVYYIKVPSTTSGYGSYSIVTRFTPATLTNDPEPNNYAKNAVTLTANDSLSGRLSYYYQGAIDQVDWYKISLPTDGKLEVLLKGESTVIFSYVDLYNDTSKTYLYESTWGNINTSVYYNALSKDDYYIKVPVSSGYGSYWIVAKYTPCTLPNDVEPNDSAKYAIPLAIDDSLTGHLNAYSKGNIDKVDWYKIYLPEAGNLRVNLEGLNMIFSYIEIYDSTLNLYLDQSSWGYSETYVEAAKVPKGNYYVKVPVADGYNSYKIKTSYIPAPSADFSYNQSLYNFSFNNHTALGKTYSWDFGDLQASSLVNPSHVYSQAGVYNVCLIAKNDAGEDTLCKFVSIKGIQAVKENHAGNLGEATIYVYGGGFTQATTFKLTRTGQSDITGDTVIQETKGSIRSTFNLYNKLVGKWNVVIDIPDDTTMIIPDGFTIEDGRPADPWVDIVGRDKILFNRWQTFNLAYGNNGNEDAKGVPVWLVLSDIEGLEIRFDNFVIGLPQMAVDSGWNILNEVPVYYITDNISGESFAARVYPLYIPRIAAGTSRSVKIKIKTPSSIRMMAWVNNPLYHSPMNSKLSDCLYWANAKAVANSTIGYIPGANCAYSVLNHYYDPFEYPMPEENKTKETWGSFLWGWASTGLTCVSNIIPGSAALANLAVTTVSTTMDFMDGKASIDACYEAFGEKSKKDKPVKAVSSYDPNEIIGPKGYNVNNYILKNNTLPYTIYYENKANATAPAHEVIVSDTLDKLIYDLSTFTFGSFGFGDTAVYPDAGLKEFTKDVYTSSLNVNVRLLAKFDTTSGIAQWRFISLDPLTGDTIEDPMVGFLPPNIASPEGEGFVSFSVGLKATVINNTSFSNHAIIQFDANQVIRTNDYENTIDIYKPESSMDVLTVDSTTNSSVNLSWTGNDDGAGVRNYSIFVAKNDSAYKPWIINTKNSSYFFTGVAGNIYKFYSVSVDSLGNTEDVPVVHDISIKFAKKVIIDNLDEIKFNVWPTITNSTASIIISTGMQEFISLNITDITGKSVTELTEGDWVDGEYKATLYAKDYEPGLYILTLKTIYGQLTKKIIIEQ